MKGQTKKKKPPKVLVLDDHLIERLIRVAREDWNNWRDVFEGGGKQLLAEPGDRFDKFCREYSVGRTIRADAGSDFRQQLRADLHTAIDDNKGDKLDRLERELRRKFGTHGGKRRVLSVVSKVAAFTRPERFVAWDRYAKKGLNILLRRPASAPFHTYAEYLAAFDCAWNGCLVKR